MNLEEASRLYEEMTYIDSGDESMCECVDNIIIPDSNQFYLVCNKCGTVQGEAVHCVIDYNDRTNFMIKSRRYYKRSSYLRTKMNVLFRNKKQMIPDAQLKTILKKVKKINIGTLTKFMKKNKLMAYDPIKTMFNIKKVAPVALSDEEMTRLLHNFNRKERVYRNNNYKRFNYNFILMKIFEEWERPDLLRCLRVLQDDKILDKHEQAYQQLFH